MSGALERALTVLETLSAHPEGQSLSALAEAANMPASAAHRLLVDLARCGYVRQARDHGEYTLTIKLVSLGLNFLSLSGVVDIAQPFLDRFAGDCGELVRLAVVDGSDLTFVAKAQGATGALRYDPDMGLSVPLSCSAAGHAWLSTMPEEKALEMVARQGFGSPEKYGRNAPTTVKALLPYLRQAKKRGFSTIVEVFATGMTAMSAPVCTRDGEVLGVVTIAGPLFRLPESRMMELGPRLVAAAAEIADTGRASRLFKPKAA
jgi:IclR family transcriptional regulator, acetate operon repressor